MTFLMTLTDLLAHAVTFKMDIVKQAAALIKQIKKIDTMFSDGTPLSDQQRSAKKAQHAALLVQLQAILAQL